MEDKKTQLEKRLREAFSERWTTLSEEEKTYALNKFHEHVWPKRVPARETLAGIAHKGLSFGTLFLGAIIAILGGLVVNILHDYFKQFGFVYIIGASGAFLFFLWWIDKLLEGSIIEDYKNNNFLDELLEGYEKPQL